MSRKKIKNKIDEELRQDNIEIDNIEKDEIEDIKIYKTKIYNVEDKALLITIGGVPKRVYFDLSFKDLEYYKDNKDSYKNKLLTIYYIGDLSDLKKVKILPVKNLDDIGGRF